MNANEISPKANSRMNRIRKASKIARVVLLATLILQALAMAIGFPLVVLYALNRILQGASWSQAAFTNCSTVLASPFIFMITLNFFRLFSRFKDGRLFNAQTVRHLEIAGKWWIVLGIIQIILQSFQAYIFHPQNIAISGTGIIAGLIVFFVGWVFREAQELQEEQELTV
jgi:hypothetical protein